MLKGAAKTLTAKLVQTHPRTVALSDPFAKKWESKRIKQNPPKFNRISSLKVKICSARINIVIHVGYINKHINI